jgi:hypothetical protein
VPLPLPIIITLNAIGAINTGPLLDTFLSMRLFTAVASGLCTILTLTACGQKPSKRAVVGRKYAEQQINAARKGTATSLLPHSLLTTQALAIAVAEPILFHIYGKSTVISERPYESYLLHGFWYIAGTLPEDYVGGTFEIILDAKDGRVIFLSHGK